MNVTIQTFGSLRLLSIATSCGNSLADSPIVDRYVQVSNDRILSCDQQPLKDTVRIPLGYFAEYFERLKLDNRDEALVGQSGITISENYLLTHSSYPPTVFKFFDRKTGAFIDNNNNYYVFIYKLKNKNK